MLMDYHIPVILRRRLRQWLTTGVEGHTARRTLGSLVPMAVWEHRAAVQDLLESVPRAQAACPYTRPTGAWKYKTRIYDRSVNDAHQGQCAFWEGSLAQRLRFGDMGSGSTLVKGMPSKSLGPVGLKRWEPSPAVMMPSGSMGGV